ncbi:hypothetical protein IV203_010057 [Nitzschia inconspicua]|uniref:Uncharacterized protein n=1 Tax=Nitzschia inconspicua TaxID=303405 RepID=A0A9K3PK50_9STRA|nr:hypothetical protein IV203_010057 [Nitzschia inconspicua]
MRRIQRRSEAVVGGVWIIVVALVAVAVNAFVPTTIRSSIHNHPTNRSFRTAIHAEQDSLMDKLMDATSTLETASSPSPATTLETTTFDQATISSTPSLPDVVESVATTVTQSGTDGSSIADLSTVALVAGQENYGLAIVLLGEAIWSFVKAPSVDHGLKTLLPAIIAAVVLVVVSGPMITSEDASSVFTGLGIATAVSVLMGVVYVARLAAPYSPSPKEIPALGLLVAFAGFSSFSQNLVVDGFVTLPSLPPLPSLPSIELPF